MQKVTVVVQDGAEPFGLGSLVEVWGESYHPEDDNPVFDFKVCTPRPGRVTGRSDYDMYVERGLEATADADLVCLSPKYDFMQHDPAADGDQSARGLRTPVRKWQHGGRSSSTDAHR